MSTQNLPLPPSTLPSVSAQALATNKVIKNTYTLLTMTVAFSALTAYVALNTGAPPLPWWMALVIMLGGPFLINAFRASVWSIPLTFAFTGALGYVAGPIVGMYLTMPGGSAIVFNAMATTAVIFFALSGYALTTRKNFSFLGGFVMVGCLVVLAAIVANIFLNIPALSLAISAAAVLLMSAAILWDTSRMVNEGETNYVMMTVSLFANIFVMFMHLLNLFSFLSGDD
jgi:modulator of FtsH protease